MQHFVVYFLIRLINYNIVIKGNWRRNGRKRYLLFSWSKHKKQRKIKGLTQLQLANKTFFSYEFIRKIESKSACRNTFSLDTLSKIAQALEIDIRLLFEPLEENPPSNNNQKMA